MNAIQLLGLITCKHLKLYGIEPLLEAFVEDLHQLEQVTECVVQFCSIFYIILESLKVATFLSTQTLAGTIFSSVNVTRSTVALGLQRNARYTNSYADDKRNVQIRISSI